MKNKLPVDPLASAALRAIENAPGLEAISYRAGDRAGFLAALLAHLGVDDPQALAALTTRDPQDFSLALLDAWASAADVLTFYDERIANESFLRSATELRSLQWLGRLIGYEPTPGLAASTYLAFSLDTAAGSPTRVVIPAGTQAQSIPQESVPQEGGEMPQPQPYETLADFIARPEWNALRPRLTRLVEIGPDTRSAWFNLEGAAGSLKTGDMLLFLGPPPDEFISLAGKLTVINRPEVRRRPQPIQTGRAWAAARVTAVDPQPGNGLLHLKWSDPLKKESHPIPSGAQVFYFRQRAAVFGHNAADWRSLPDEAKASYLGTQVAKLSAIEQVEWPHYVIAAPLLDQPNQRWRVAYFPPTPETVAEAAKRAADAAFKAALVGAIMAPVVAVQKVLTAVTGGLDAMASFGSQVTDPASIEGKLNPVLITLTDSIVNLLKPFVPSTNWSDLAKSFNMGTFLAHITAADSQALYDIVDPLKRLIMVPDLGFLSTTDANTLLGGVTGALKTLVEVPIEMLKQLGISFKNLGGAIQDAINAVNDVPNKAGAFMGTLVVTQLVKITVKEIMEAPLPFPRTPWLVAFFALVAARLPAAVVDILNLNIDLSPIISALQQNNPGLVTAQFNGLLNALQLFAQGKSLTKDQLDAASAEAAKELAALGLAVAVVGAGATIAGALIGIGIAGSLAVIMGTFLMPAIVAALAITGFVIAAGVLTAGVDLVIFGPGIKDGLQSAQKTICDAIFGALENDAQRRRALPVLASDQVDLDNIYQAIAPDSWALLALPDGQAAPYQVTGVAEAGRSDFNLNGRVTRLTLEGAALKIVDEYPESEEEDLNETALQESSEPAEDPFLRQVRNTTVFAQSTPLSLAGEPDPAPVEGERIELNAPIPAVDLAFGRPVILQGRLMQGTTLPGAESSAITSEVAFLATVAPAGALQTGALTFQKSLAGRYQRDSLSLFLNAAEATHGATQREVLGSGDASLSGQRFNLRGSPLTYTRGLQSSLEVRVNGLAWHAVANPFNAGPGEHAYTLHTADDGTLTIEFGDGQTGSRLPSGQENVSAVYRTGAGRKGQAGAGRITLLTRYPPGVRSVTNPVPAGGYSDPRSLADTRQVIPAPAVALDRAVSLEDYAMLAHIYAGVSKALATWTWDALGRSIFLTVASQDGQAYQRTDLDAIQRAVRQKGDERVRLIVQDYRKVLFQVSGRLVASQDAEGQAVMAAVLLALQQRYAFQNRSFGQPVTLQEVITAIQGVPGVQAVDIDGLYRLDQPAVLNSRLAAAMPYAGQDGSGAAQAAELLVLGSPSFSLVAGVAKL